MGGKGGGDEGKEGQKIKKLFCFGKKQCKYSTGNINKIVLSVTSVINFNTVSILYHEI